MKVLDDRCFLPIKINVVSEYSSEPKNLRFLDVTIDVMHTGLNRKGTNFPKEVVDANIETIYNTPILGYIKSDNNDDDESDFEGHKHKIIIDDNGIRYVYAGSAYGVIPESCNPRWVIKECEDGVEREFLRVDGILWTKFEDAIEIVGRDLIKGHSMEITNLSGHKEKDKGFVIDSFEFDGCCILGDDVIPGMIDSDIVLNYSLHAEDIASEIKEKLKEYAISKNDCHASKEDDNNKSNLEGEKTEMNDKNELLEKYGVQLESLNFSLEDVTLEELEKKLKEMSNYSSKSGTSAETQEPEKAEYTLNMMELLEEIRKELGKYTYIDRWKDERCQYWLVDVQGSEVIVTDCKDNYTLCGMQYACAGDKVTIDVSTKKRKKTTYADFEDGTTAEVVENPMPMYFEEKIDSIISKYTAEVDELKKYQEMYSEIKPKYDEYVAAEQAAIEKANEEKRAALFSLMDEKIGGMEEYEALKSNTEMEYSMLENACYAIYGRKASEFSYVPTKKKAADGGLTKFGVGGAPLDDKEDEYGELFKKYGSND